jgi:hypothetical protein
MESRWGFFICLAAAGMTGLAVCLLKFPRRARLAAWIAVLLLVLHAAMLPLIGSMDRQSMGGGMLIYFGLLGTAVFGVVPVLTLLLLVSRGT